MTQPECSKGVPSDISDKMPSNGTDPTGEPFQIAKSPIPQTNQKSEISGKSSISHLIYHSEISEVGSIDLSRVGGAALSPAKQFEQAKIQLNKGNFTQAIEKFDSSISSKYQVFNSLRLKAVAYLFDNKFDSSAKCYQELMEKYPERPESYYGKGLALALMGNQNLDTIKNEELFEKAIKINDKDWRCYFCQGYYKIKTKNYDHAFDLITKSITMNSQSNYPMAYIARAELFSRRGNFVGARKDIQYARKAVRENNKQNVIMSFQAQKLEENFQIYDKIMQKLNNAEKVGSLLRNRREQYEGFMLKSLSRSAMMNNQAVFVNAATKIETFVEQGNSQVLDSDLIKRNQDDEHEQPPCEWIRCTIF